jgi:peptidoglycan hydrolase CwlO-like protein
MKKKLIALIAAVLMTSCVAIVMLAIGGAALFNKNGIAAADTTGKVVAVNATTDQAAQIQQLQATIEQYKAREQEYQQREQQYQAQIQQYQTQVSQVQQLLEFLQERGIITVTSDGRIFVNR